jgi:hypothetical protein
MAAHRTAAALMAAALFAKQSALPVITATAVYAVLRDRQRSAVFAGASAARWFAPQRGGISYKRDHPYL